MLAYILALAVALGSFAIYIAAFFFPEIHRKNDFIWSGVGMFYALVLWVCAGRITGGVLLGQIASVTLLGWFGWQTVTLRYSLTPAAQRTPVPSQDQIKDKLATLSIPEPITKLFTTVKGSIQTILSKPKPQDKKPVAPVASVVTKDAVVDSTTVAQVEAASPTPVVEEIKADTPKTETITETVPPTPVIEEIKADTPKTATITETVAVEVSGVEVKSEVES